MIDEGVITFLFGNKIMDGNVANQEFHEKIYLKQAEKNMSINRGVRNY